MRDGHLLDRSDALPMATRTPPRSMRFQQVSRHLRSGSSFAAGSFLLSDEIEL